MSKSEKIICHLTSSHPRYDVRIFEKECVSLTKKYSDVYLIVADGYPDEIYKGVNIVNVGNSSRNRLARFFIKNYKVYRYAVKLKADIYHFHDFELSLFGILLAFSGKKVIYDTHENMPSLIMQRDWVKNYFFKVILKRFILFVELILNKAMHGIISVTPKIVSRFSNKNKAIIANFPILNENELKRYELNRSNDEFYLIYAGTLAKFRNIHILIESLAHVKSNVKLRLIGKWESEAFKNYCSSLDGFNKVEVLPYMKSEDVYDFIRKSDIGLNTVGWNVNLKEGYPVKVFEYMFCGVPALISAFDEWKEVFNDTVFYSDPDNPHELANMIDFIVANPEIANFKAEAAYQLVLNQYSWRSEEAKLFSLYDKIV